MYTGIDVSRWQGAIDWKKVAAAGIQFAIIRCVDGDLRVDASFEYNYREAKENGLAVGVYKYSYATTVDEAEAEAKKVVDVLRGKQLEAKVWLDLEDKCQQNLDKDLFYEIVKKFLGIVSEAGYQVGIYCNQYWYKSILTDEIKSLTDNYWIAKWSTVKPNLGEIAWQYTSTGSVDGIRGNVDLDYYYAEFDSVDSAGPTLVPVTPGKSVEELAREVIAGKWGNGVARREALEKAGYDYETVQAKVNKLLEKDPAEPQEKPQVKSVEELAKEVLAGKWGNGTARREALEKAGYSYEAVQAKVNELVHSIKPVQKGTKSVEELAREVIAGKWGNGAARREALEKAGYSYEAVQKRVNEILE